MRKVKIKVLPKAKNGVETKSAMWNGMQLNWPSIMNQFSQPNTKVNSTLQPVDRDEANLEAEKNEQVVINQGGIPTNFKVGGKRHSEGGTPLNLPAHSFVFSDTKDMKIKDPTILAQFGITSGIYTPADIAKKYDINKYRAILADKDASDLDKKTAEIMIANYNMKLAKLSLVQESKKGFPQGIPSIAMPYMESLQINPDDIVDTQSQQTPFSPDMMQYGGFLPIAQDGIQTEIQQYLRTKDLETKKYKTETENYFNDAMKDNAQYQENAALRNLYNKMRAKNKEGDIESKWYEFLPGVDPSAESYLNMFKTAALKYHQNPDNLLKQYDLESGYVKPQAQKASVTPTKTVQQPTGGAYDVELSPEEAKALGINAFGGAIDTYQKGGSNTKKYSLTPEQYLKLQAMRKKGSTTVPNTKSNGTTSVAKPSEFNPYGQSLEELQSYLVPGAELRKGNVSTHQSETSKGSGMYGDTEVSVDQFLKNNPTFAKDFATKHPGQAYDPKNKAHVEEFQNYYNPSIYKKVYDQLKTRGASEDKAKQMADLAVSEFGFRKGEKAREFDSKHGQFTGSRMELQFKEPEAKTEPSIEEPIKTIAGPVEKKQIPVARQQGHDPWWLQDIVKTAGAAGDFFRVKKYSPWQATPGVKLPDPTFYDPSRELAANAELANIGTQGIGAFTNPQAFAAAFSQIQGQGAKNAANIMSQYNNMNVGVANDFEVKRSDMENQYSANLSGLSTQLSDKYAILNQQFDNSRNMARQNLRQSYIDAVTNKNYTGNLNDLYEQYKIDPRVGGRIKWTHGRPITPEANDTDMVSKINSTAGKFMEMNPGLKREEALNAAMKLHTGSGSSNNQMYDPSAMKMPGF